MKKLLALIVALLCVFAVTFTACSDNDADKDKEGDKTDQTDGNKKDDDEKDDEQGNKNDQTDDEDETGEHVCKYKTEWSSDASTHWHDSACKQHPGNISDEAPHEYTSLDGTCKVCDAPTPDTFYEGDKIPYFSFSTYNNSSATYSTESAKGKVLVINFWYRTCTPCVEEMPIFDELSNQYGDDVVVVALHSSNGEQSGAENFINGNGWSDYNIIFGLDKDNAFYDKLGGNGMYPITIVVDGEGIIVSVIEGQVIRQEGLDNPKIVDYINPAIKKALGK